MTIHFAPIQGFTNYFYRKAHHEICGGVERYYTPFLRWEKEGLRNKDLRDILMTNIGEVPTTPQIICDGREEMARLCDIIEQEGHHRIDINMGCPFPMQVRRGRGAGLLSRPQSVQEIVDEIGRRPEVAFSVKMRLGTNNNEDWKTILPILNSISLSHITLHPRNASQMYKGSIDMDSFDLFLDGSNHPVVYNGDLTTREQMTQLAHSHPRLTGLMLGRGLLASPTLAYEFQHPEVELSDQERLDRLWRLHDSVYQHCTTHLQGDSQVLSHLHSFWEYPTPILDKKHLKRLSKSGSLRSYNESVALAKRSSR